MHHKILLLFVLTTLVVLALVAHPVAAQANWGTVQIISVSAPVSVTASQPQIGKFSNVTIIITISYTYQAPTIEQIIVALTPASEYCNVYEACFQPYGPPLNDISSSCSQAKNSPPTAAFCTASTPASAGLTKVSFTVVVPSIVETWSPIATASLLANRTTSIGYGWYVMAYSFKAVPINITSPNPVPESPSVLLLLIPALLVQVYVLRRKKSRFA